MVDLTPRLTNTSVYLPSEAKSDDQHHLILIPGNPGCIGHYHGFLTLLQSKFQASSSSTSLSVYGASLPNFTNDDLRCGEHGPVLGLSETVESVKVQVLEYVKAQRATSREMGPVKVILCGHSLGAYIGLEVIEWWRGRDAGKASQVEMEIVGYLGLWPTVVWLDQGPSGKSKSVSESQWLNTPGFPAFLTFTLQAILKSIPSRLLMPICTWSTGQPDYQVKATVEMFKSKYGIRQMVYLLKDTVNQIREDRWTSNVWGSTDAQDSKAPKLVFHFGEADGMVNDEIRDELIARRGRSKDDDRKDEQWKPIMNVDTEKIPHAFFEKHNEPTAELAARYLTTIVSG